MTSARPFAVSSTRRTRRSSVFFRFTSAFFSSRSTATLIDPGVSHTLGPIVLTGNGRLWEQHFEDACGSGVHMPAIRSDYILLADHSVTNDIASTSTRPRGTSSIFFRCHAEDAFESLAKRRIRVVANRLCYLEQLPIVFL